MAAHGAHLAIVEREAVEAVARKRQRNGRSGNSRCAKRNGRCTKAHRRRETRAGCLHGKDKVYANLADIARMLEIASKLGRLATGLANRPDGMDGRRWPGVRVESTVGAGKDLRRMADVDTVPAKPDGQLQICRQQAGENMTPLGTIFYWPGAARAVRRDQMDKLVPGRSGFAGAATGRVRGGAAVRCAGRADGHRLRRRSRRREIVTGCWRKWARMIASACRG